MTLPDPGPVGDAATQTALDEIRKKLPGLDMSGGVVLLRPGGTQVVVGDLEVQDFAASSANVSGAVACATIDTGNGAVELAAGTWTPNLTHITNLDASTAQSGQYQRVGNTVTCGLHLQVDPTTISVATEIEFTLPIATNMAAVGELAGAGGASAVVEPWGCFANAVADRGAAKTAAAGSTSNHNIFLTFTYRIV